jgi:3-oxoacyl-[acyl-carrier protein] reductase
MDLELRGRTAIVCGASSGMGLAIARGLAAEGADVVMAARRRELLDKEAAAISAVSYPVDLSEPAAAQDLVDAAVKRFGRLDVVVWNSGGPPATQAQHTTADDLTAGFHSLLLPLVRLVGAALPHLRASDAGRILAITSAGSKEPLPNLAISNTLRPGVHGYLKSLSNEIGRDGITVNCLAPGYIDTDRVRQIHPDGPSADMLDDVAVGRLGTADEFADVAVFLASPRASYVTGATISVDGGRAHSLY